MLTLPNLYIVRDFEDFFTGLFLCVFCIYLGCLHFKPWSLQLAYSYSRPTL